MSTLQYPPPAGPPATAATACRCAGLTKVYGRGEAAVRALDGVDVTIERGSFTAVMGPSGSGKSTLMHLLAGLDTPSAGQVWLGDTELTRLNDTQLAVLRRERVGFVFQAFNLVDVLTAEQNILLPARLAGVSPDKDRFAELTAQLGLADRLTHRPAELSGGQQQRVALARALLTNPEVVFADEPTGALDSRTGQEVLGYLRRSVRHEGQTVVMVTHDPVAATYADRVLLLADGRLAGQIEHPDTESVLDAIRALGR